MVWVFVGCSCHFIYFFMMTEIALDFCGNLYHLQSRRTVQKLLPSGKLGSTCGLEIMQACMIRFVDSIGVQRFRFSLPHLQVSYCALYNRYQFIGKLDTGFVWRILYRTWWLIMWESLYVERSYLNTIGYSIGMNYWQNFEGEIDDNIVTLPKFDIQKATTRPSSFSRRYFCGPELVHR